MKAVAWHVKESKKGDGVYIERDVCVSLLLSIFLGCYGSGLVVGAKEKQKGMQTEKEKKGKLRFFFLYSILHSIIYLPFT